MNCRYVRAWVAAALCLALLGCADGGNEDLTNWMAEQRAKAQPRMVEVAEPKAFAPQVYGGEGATSPFSEEKLAVLLRAQAESPVMSALISAEKDRRKEPLELIPLDAMTMVGTLHRGLDMVALVRSDQLLYQIRVGNYMGQNFGRVTAITETQIRLREIVEDEAGVWIERSTILQLQEAAGR